MKVLFIEDNAGGIHAMRRTAHALNFELHVARSGQEGLAMLDASYDLLLLDMELPDGNGLTLMAKLRPAYPRLPIIAVTANTLPDDRERCLAAGCTDYLGKPFRLEELAALLRRYRPGA